ncbi:MAG: precorrin-3B C(17)-methyltransferase [Faecalibacterium sp.]
MNAEQRSVRVVGLGPGAPEFLTAQARAALDAAQVLCGYTVYIDLVRPLYPEKECYSTGMTQELARCRWALETAHGGRSVALVCSGDAGVYGMASPLLELAQEYPDVTVEIVPGLTAALSGGALLGAPLAHDFCVISLSDRLIPWEVIEKRLACAAMGDFALVLYNPASRGRPDALHRAAEILLKNGKPPETVCGLARCIGREGESTHILTLDDLREAQADMFTTVFVGNGQTRSVGGRMVTPRGYRRT